MIIILLLICIKRAREETLSCGDRHQCVCTAFLKLIAGAWIFFACFGSHVFVELLLFIIAYQIISKEKLDMFCVAQNVHCIQCADKIFNIIKNVSNTWYHYFAYAIKRGFRTHP